MQVNKAIILLRGLPGSGKSTFAQFISEQGKHPIFSVDDFFTDIETLEYNFNFQQNHLAYKQCEMNCRKAAVDSLPRIIVHNTFTMDWEMEPYFKLAAEHNYVIFVLTVEKYHESKNIHEISDEQIAKMSQKYKVKLF
jgi:predicted kinase